MAGFHPSAPPAVRRWLHRSQWRGCRKHRPPVLGLILVVSTLLAAAMSRGLTWASPTRGSLRGAGGGQTLLEERPAEGSHNAARGVQLSYSHLHFYCDSLRPLDEYKALESKLNELSGAFPSATTTEFSSSREKSLAAAAERWRDAVADGASESEGHTAQSLSWLQRSTEDYTAVGQDLVEQLLVGLGWRVVAAHEGPSTRTYMVSSKAGATGVQFVITAPLQRDEGTGHEKFEHFERSKLDHFASCHGGRQGAAVLGFETGPGSVEHIRERYLEMHPGLLVSDSIHDYDGARVLEVYAYYLPGKHKAAADKGTIIRFVEKLDVTDDGDKDGVSSSVLPGLQGVAAQFETEGQPAYSDHWVSNVFDRQGFLDTLEETLGFTPKVDFNAGVVAAGEAQIESTVTGNSPNLQLDAALALTDKRQIYLPINNHLSDVGHVHLFLQELGQGVQHVATRVPDLCSLIQCANDRRKVTGAGFSFLPIPPSYYGYLTEDRLKRDANLPDSAASRAFASLREAGLVDSSNIVKLEATSDEILAALPADLHDSGIEEHVLRGRYNNLYGMLGDTLSQEQYLKVMRNHILVDVQGEDVLMQIFTSKVLQRNPGEEAPFLEFIQRLCSACGTDAGVEKPRVVRPGCGGFGIRNFLTLFISIELSKAAQAKAEAESSADEVAASIARRTQQALMDQLEESNPILNEISEAMTAEGAALQRDDLQDAERWAEKKDVASRALQELSAKYAKLTAKIRTSS